MYTIKETYLFPNCDKVQWIRSISVWSEQLSPSDEGDNCVKLTLGKGVVKGKFLPFHIVTLSCFIELIKKKGYLVLLNVKNRELSEFIHNDMNLTRYWKGEKSDHIDSPDSSRLNLWRVTKGRAEEYEASVHRYFSNKFSGVDFFMLKTCLTELYFNIFDHAEANGIAFSYIHYDDAEEMIHIAICDFGKGISKTIRAAYPDINDDEAALLMSLKKGVSARSNQHNAGFGLDNVVSALSDDSTLRMASNKAFLICSKKTGNIETKTYTLHFELKGTLIYFDLPISGFELTEINEEFTF